MYRLCAVNVVTVTNCNHTIQSVYVYICMYNKFVDNEKSEWLSNVLFLKIRCFNTDLTFLKQSTCFFIITLHCRNYSTVWVMLTGFTETSQTNTATEDHLLPELRVPRIGSVWSWNQWGVHWEACTSFPSLNSGKEWAHSSLQTMQASFCTLGGCVLFASCWKLKRIDKNH